MKNFRWWPAFGVTAAAALTACGNGGSGSGDVSIRVANATLTHTSLDLLVSGAVVVPTTGADAVSAYTTTGSGTVALQFNDAGGSTALSAFSPTLSGGGHFTLLAYESSGVVKTAILGEDIVLPASGTTLRIYDAAPEAGKLDVYITSVTVANGACGVANLSTLAPSTSFGALSAPAAATQQQGAGNWTVCVTGSGSKSDLRMTLPIVLTNAAVATVALTPASGGALLNGSLLIQQGAYTAARNTNSRVRLANAVSGSANVTATATSAGSSYAIDAGSVSPAFGFYALVPAQSALNVTVAGSAVQVGATPTLVAGGDATLLVYSSPTAGTTATLIADDNRPPTDATTTKVRMINGVTGSAGTLTLTANTSPIGVNVAPGAASPYASVTGSTNPVSFSLSSSTSGTLPTLPPTVTLTPNAVNTILVGGAISPSTGQQLVIR